MANNMLEDVVSGKGKFKGSGIIRHKEIAAHIICKDGVTLSVQASKYHYCSPRDDTGPYMKVEVGFPSIKPPETWSEYAENWAEPTGTVYGYIPVELVRQFIADHGGER